MAGRVVKDGESGDSELAFHRRKTQGDYGYGRIESQQIYKTT